jgi:L-lactate dehydrogenase (cytochrome)
VLESAANVADVRQLARRRLPHAVFDFVEGGAEDEITITRNRSGFSQIAFVPSALTDVSARDQSTTVLGTPVESPIVLSPVGLAALAHPDGEVAAARAATQAGLISTLSSSSAHSLEAVARSCEGPKWFQLYVWRDRELTRKVVERARAAGYTALVLTVDVAVSARRERDLHNGFVVPPKPRLSQATDVIRHAAWFRAMLLNEAQGHGIGMGNFTPDDLGLRQRLRMIDVVNDLFDPSMSWRDLEWLKQVWGGPIVIKGVLTAADARRSVDCGADAIWVSNHGGRQLDGVQATVTLLPAIVDAVGKEAEIYLDGGVRRGSDVVKALSLGATACMIGRPYVYGLAAGGEAGVGRVLSILRSEIDATMALLGRPRIKDLDHTAVALL